MSRQAPERTRGFLRETRRRKALLFAALALATLAACAPRVLAQGAFTQAKNAPRAAMFSGFPGDANDAKGRAILQQELRASGYDVISLSPTQMTSADELSSARFDLLVLPDARRLPSASALPLRDYLTRGGNVVALGLPLWSQALSQANGRWMTRDQYEATLAAVPMENVFFDFANDLAGWQKSHSAQDVPAEYSLENENGRRVLHARIADFKGWNTFGHTLPAPFAAGQSLLVFRARGSNRTSQLSVEIDERDGSRWIASIDLAPQWKNYALSPDRFKAWLPSGGRGGAGDHLNPQNAAQLYLGVSQSHTVLNGGAHQWWISSVGSARDPFPGQTPPALDEAPYLQSLSPAYQTFPIHGAVTFGAPNDAKRFAANGVLFGLHARPNATGFDKRRKFRWQELLNARAIGDAKTLASTRGGYRGALAALVANTPTESGGALWAALTVPVSDASFYAQPIVRRVLRETLMKMRRGALLQEGGSRTFTAFEGENVVLGARVASQKSGGALQVRVRVLAPNAKAAAFEKTWPLNIKAGETATVSTWWKPQKWPRGGFQVVTELLDGAAKSRVLDTVSHELNVWIPKRNPQFIVARNGHFFLNGKRWKANGVNYMPSSGMGLNDGEIFEKWISAPSYDPEIVERDLRHIRALGFNAVSAFVYYDERHDTNTVDFLRRCENLGLKVNLSLRPGIWPYSKPPLQFDWNATRSLIEDAKLAQSDTVFALDMAWEPSHYTHEFQRGYLPDWTRWIDAHYGNLENAERAWGVAAPRENGALSVPPMSQLQSDGEWRVLARDYRTFLDEFLEGKYGEPRRLVRSIDPHHAVSFRMQFSGDPLFSSEGLLPYDFYGLRRAVDVWEPEAYGRVGDWNAVRVGRFTADYARLNNPNLPVMWAEVGNSVWNMAQMQADEEKLRFTAAFYRDFYRMLRESDADGLFFWWYPGGFRPLENSDYGLVNADGTMRPQTRVLAEEGRKFLAAPTLPAPNIILLVERDADARGLNAMYTSIQADYWRAIEEGKRPALRWQHEPQGARGALQK